MSRARRTHNFDGLEGCVTRFKPRQTGTLVGVYFESEENDPEYPWASVCEIHGILVCHRTRQLAIDHARDPQGWCQWCRSKGSLFIIVGEDIEPFPIEKFLEDNKPMAEDERESLLELEVNEEATFGGGAAAEFTVRRVK